jgi:hypothetical protein
MSDIATYTFLPWLRQGIANQINGQSGIRATIPVNLVLSGNKPDGSTETRPPIQKEIQIYGPGDIIGIDSKAIIKVEPHNWITNFEPNYLPYIDFYDEDFPWRYSPMVPAANRLQPWIMLIVLKESEFKDGKNIKDRPLPFIQLQAEAKLPPSSQLWAWVHVHVNTNLIADKFVSNNSEDIQSKLAAVLTSDPDMAYSRILCPRKLEDKTAYHAFLVPVFKSGLLAGLGQDPTSSGSQFDTLAWADNSLPTEIPYYYRWYFRTGTVGDFEYLVRLLKPKPVDSRVGLRDMDVQKPGANIKGIIDAADAIEDQKLGGILKLGGALRIPDIYYNPEEFSVVEKYRNWATLNNTQPYPHDFQKNISAFINLTDSYQIKKAQDANSQSGINEEQTADDPDIEFDISQNPDPLITAPLYARWHSLTQRLLKYRDDTDVTPNDNWVHEINLDPRWRVASGFGTKVIQDNQEDYMKSAWDQVGEVLEANKKIRNAQLAKEVSWVWHQNHFKTIKEKYSGKWLMMTAPLQNRVINDGITVSYQIKQSKIPYSVFTAPMRKLVSPRGNLVKRMQSFSSINLSFNNNAAISNFVARLNTGEISPAPTRIVPVGINTLQNLSDTLKPKNLPDPLINLLRNYKWLKWVPLIVALIIVFLLLIINPSTAIYLIGIGVVGGLIIAYRQLNNLTNQLTVADSVLEKNQTVELVEQLPKSPDFKISTPQENFTPTFNGSDSEEAVRFKSALKNLNNVIQVSAKIGATPVKPKINFVGVNDAIYQAINPELTIPRWVWGSVIIPARILSQLKEKFVEAMAYPEFDLPMYKPLVTYSSELFLPNINFIAQNSISLLETNQKFIESYLVGLNHEFARELLWREYPTDQRGSYFRQFWETRGYYDTEVLTAEELKEKLKDIPPIHLWSKYSNLGDHDNREVEGKNEEEVVLVIRGELLKKYPNAVIYAQRAVWKDKDGNRIWKDEQNHIIQMDEEGNITTKPNGDLPIDLTKERDLKPLPDDEETAPPGDIVKPPLYEAKVDPDIYFFGFDLTVCKAKGGNGDKNEPVDSRCVDEGVKWDDAGWFFVIKERPGEPRFGLDIGSEESNVENGKIEVWNDLSWTDIKPTVADGEFIQIPDQTSQSITADQQLELPEDSEKQEQQGEDKEIKWTKDMSSSELAYILYQVPVLVAVHASEMLPKD